MVKSLSFRTQMKQQKKKQKNARKKVYETGNTHWEQDLAIKNQIINRVIVSPARATVIDLLNENNDEDRKENNTKRKRKEIREILVMIR